MARQAQVLSISLPLNLSKAVDKLARATGQNRSELIRSALREYIADETEDKTRFISAYKATRKEKTMSLKDIKKKYKV